MTSVRQDCTHHILQKEVFSANTLNTEFIRGESVSIQLKNKIDTNH